MKEKNFDPEPLSIHPENDPHQESPHGYEPQTGEAQSVPLATQDTDVLGDIEREMSKADAQAAADDGDTPVNTWNMLIDEALVEWIKGAAQRPVPANLWHSLWYEGELSCLFADSNVGKSIYAVQIGNELARQGRAVAYFDFEMNDKQIQMRYTDEHTGALYDFPYNFRRIELRCDSPDAYENFEENLINSIEQYVQRKKVKILIIDNLTYLCVASEKGNEAGPLMIRLKQLKEKYGLSILILAHTPKRQLMTNPITQNDLAGSKKLFNLFDSVFTIGFSTQGQGVRYVKQMKARYSEYLYGEDNVMVYHIEKTGSFLHFEFIGYATEREHLKTPTDEERDARAEQIRRLHESGKTVRQIAEETGIPRSTIGRLVKGGTDAATPGSAVTYRGNDVPPNDKPPF